MHIFKNKLKADLKAGETRYGAFVTSPCPEVVEVLAVAGYDFVIIDTEHTASNIETVVDMIRAAEAYGMTAVVRVPDDTSKNISRYQDVGAYGVQIPMVHTAEQAEAIVKAMKFMPDGIRGMSGGRGTAWGRIDNYRQVSNDETLIAVMCESKQGLENIDEIVKVPGVDAVFIGAYDLSQALGVPGQTTHPLVEEAVQKVLDACLKAGVIPGIVSPDVDLARRRALQGFRYITILDDMAFFMDCVEQRLNLVKA